MQIKAQSVQYWVTNAARAFQVSVALWEAELLGAYEEWVVPRLGSGHDRGTIDILDSEILLRRWRSTGWETVATHPRTADPLELPEATAALLRSVSYDFANLDIRLPKNGVLMRQVTLPQAVGRHFREAIGFQLERWMPFRADHVYYACAEAERDEERGRVTIDLTVARRVLVDSLADAAIAKGARKVSVSDPNGRLLKQVSERRSDRGTLSIDTGLVLSAAILVLATAMVFGLQYHRETLRLEEQVVVLKSRAAAIVAQREMLQHRAQAISFLASRLKMPDQAEMLAEITRRLPADAWIFQLQREGEDLQIDGFSRDASVVAAELTKSASYSGVTLRSAVKAPGNDLERFNIVLHINSAGHL